MSQDVQLSGAFARLSLEDLTVLKTSFDAAINFEGGNVISAKGDEPFVGLLNSGHLCRRRTLRGGGRQLLPVAIPGDLFGALDLLTDPSDFEIVALSGGSIRTAPFASIAATLIEHSSISAAFARARQLEESILRERVVSLGGRLAMSRLSHFFCEFVTRTAPACLASGEAIFFPFNQEEMAQSCGLSTVHVNRVLKDLRLRQLIRTRFERLFILDYAGLADLAQFDPAYLQIPTEPGFLQGRPA